MTTPFDLSRLDTVQVVTPTPFSVDGRYMVPEILEQHTRNLLAAGIRVFLPAAGTGEFHSLSADEIGQCVSSTRIVAGDDCLVIAPVGARLEFALDVGRRAMDAGADALLLMPLPHPYLSDEGFRDYIARLSAGVSLPLTIYKQGPVPSDALLLELAARHVIVGVKYAFNNFDALHRFTSTAPPHLGVYCGTAERFAPFYSLCGATGFTSGAANICPRLSLKFHHLLQGQQFNQAMTLLATIRPFEDFRARENDSMNIPAMKAALSLLGIDFGPPRPPQRQLTVHEHAALEEVIRSQISAERSTPVPTSSDQHFRHPLQLSGE